MVKKPVSQRLSLYLAQDAWDKLHKAGLVSTTDEDEKTVAGSR